MKPKLESEWGTPTKYDPNASIVCERCDEIDKELEKNEENPPE